MAISLLFSIHSPAQVTDSFADGDLDQSPSWMGDTSHFEVVGQELKLDAPSQDASSSIALPSHSIGGAEWECELRLEFDPSGSNYLDLHIVSSAEDLNSPHTGYFVRVGDSEDEISLYRQNGSSIQELIDGPDGLTDTSIVNFRMKVERSGTGHFVIAVDTSGGQGYTVLDSVQDGSFQTSSFFGFECQYTPTRSEDFFFDDVEVTGSPYQDSIPPYPDTLLLPEKGQLQLHFGEPVDTTGLSASGFNLAPTGGTPDSIHIGQGRRFLDLFYSATLPNDTPMTLSIPSIPDTSGNLAPAHQRSFLYLVPGSPVKGAVVINEIMADPLPSNGSPEREFLELHAVDSLIFSLENLKLRVDDDTLVLPQRIIKPDDRILLITPADSSLFDPPSSPILLPQLPPLTNGGSILALKDSSGNPIDRVSYKREWYGNEQKEEGGWSLERIDPASECASAPNWSASEDPNGSTPGRRNSIHNADLDTKAPELRRATTLNDSTVLVRFDEAPDPDTPWTHILSIPDGPAIDAVLKGKGPQKRKVRTIAPLDSGERYRLRIRGLTDCFGNLPNGSEKGTFILPYSVGKQEIVINEILFDPRPNGADFLELYNRSPHFFDLSELELRNGEDPAENAKIAREEELIPPGGYRFLSEDPKGVAKEYPGTPLKRAIQMNSLPSYPNDSGTVVLKKKNGAIIDRFSYKDSMQHPLIEDPEGVSLERIDPNRATQKKGNWHSAASTASYGTPGERNSQFIGENKGQEGENERLWSEPDVFTPNMDGERDQLRVHFRFTEPGMSCTLSILDPRGRTVKRLLNGQILDRKGSVIWNGTKSDGSKAPIGIYVILLECVHPHGKRIMEKSTCVLGTRW